MPNENSINNLNLQAETPTAIQELLITPTLTATVQPTPTLPVLEATKVPSQTITQKEGAIYLYQPSGILEIEIGNEERDYILTFKPEWDSWGVAFAQNKGLSAYWVKQKNKTELWFSNLSAWNPQILFTIEDLNYEFANLYWAVNDRYIILFLSELNNDTGIKDDTQIVATYIFDTQTMQLVNQSPWAGNCGLLAVSDKTKFLSVWCYKGISWEESEEFLVLEPLGDPNLTVTEPNLLTDNCFTLCVWSADGQFVIYSSNDYPSKLFHAPVNYSVSSELSDSLTDIYSFLYLSPDQKYLFYTGSCVDNGVQNPIVMSVNDKKPIWCIDDKANSQKYGVVFVNQIRWSANSRYLAILRLFDFKQEIMVFDVQEKRENFYISEIDDPILDMVWIEN